MSLRAWRIVRVRSGCVNLPSFGLHLQCNLQSVRRVPGAASPRSIATSTNHRLSVGGTGDGGHREPAEDSAVEDGDLPQASGDKRLWRKWIEERLSHSEESGEAGSSSANRNFPLKETLKFASSADQSSTEKTSFYPIRDSPSEENVAAPTLAGKLIKEKRSSTALDSLIKDTLKPSSFADKEPSSRNTSLSSVRSSLLQETTKRPSPFSVKQKPPGNTEPPVDFPPVEALDDFEYRVLGTSNDTDDTPDDDFMRDLDEIGRSARGIRGFGGDEESGADEDEDWDDDKAQVLTDLALSNIEEFDLEDEERPYRLRPDRLFFPGQTYDPEDLDISKAVTELDKPTSRTRKSFPSKEVSQMADFRNPRFLGSFLRESSRILPRRQHQISAKAQRKVAREIKTARILGLMPFTSMGDPPFRFMRSRSEEDAYPGSEED